MPAVNAGQRLIALIPALLAGAVLVGWSFTAVGAGGGVASLVLVTLVLILVTWVGESQARRRARRLLAGALVVLPGAVTVFLGFNAGGFFPEATTLALLALAISILVRALVSTDPFEGFSWPVLLAAAALAGYGVWTLTSAGWSDAAFRAWLEADRVGLYLLAVLLFASMPRTSARLRWMVRVLALGIVVVCIAALASRVLPEIWRAPEGFDATRLSYPLTYWNAVGLLAGIGIVLCFHLTADAREARASRVLGAAALPLLGAVLLLTLSRGAMVVTVGGLAAYVLVARPRGLVGGVLAAVPATALALHSTHGAELLFSPGYVSPAGVAQGKSIAALLLVDVLLAAAIRLALLRSDSAIANLRVPKALRGALVAGAVALGLVATAIAVTIFDAPSRMAIGYEQFAGGAPSASPGDPRGRLWSANSPSRLAHWRVARDDFEAAPLIGGGAGTFELSWHERRPFPAEAIDAHSLYLETLGELGLVGFALLAIALLTILVTLVARARGPDRALYGALLAATAAWAAHAGIDWDWEMPAVTFWVFGLGGAAMAAPSRGQGGKAPPQTHGIRRSPGLRALVAVGALLVALPASLLAQSEARLERSQQAFRVGNCAVASVAARASLSAVNSRPEPLEVLALCAARFGLPQRGLRAAEEAVRRDPRNWRFRYALALVRGAAGLDPRPAAAAALRLNPRQPLARDAIRRFATEDPQAWRQAARDAPLRRDLAR
jgi:O-antigen ligase